MIGRLDISSGEDTQLVMGAYPLRVSSVFSLNPDGNLMAFTLHQDKIDEYETITIMELNDPSKNMKYISSSDIEGLECDFRRVLFGEQCVTQAFAKQHGCTIVEGKCIIDSQELTSMLSPDPQEFRWTGESLNSQAIILIQSIGAILIIGFIIYYAIKKRREKTINS